MSQTVSLWLTVSWSDTRFDEIQEQNPQKPSVQNWIELVSIKLQNAIEKMEPFTDAVCIIKQVNTN